MVTYDGVKMKIADSIEDDIVDFVADFQLGDYFETARWEEETQTTSVSREVEGEMRRSMIRRAGAAAMVYAMNEGTSAIQKQILLNKLKALTGNIKQKMPTSGGVLLQINCQVAATETGSDIKIKNAFISNSGSSYKKLIKKAMTGSEVIAKPLRGYHWEYLLVWVTPHKN